MKTLFLISFAALAFASPAHAQPVAAQTAVSTAGLDLGTARGVRALDLRILHAASALCGTPSPADPRGRQDYDQCRADARATVAAERERLLANARSNAPVALAAGQ
ncbi:UrcA family protein [Sphingomonas tabacisoli]|uniref:UrcA family protein n=1 Tax=Sphingomonas tabacisoli TaxID=2249466 RepID=A0ABW4HYM4_9SPHN